MQAGVLEVKTGHKSEISAKKGRKLAAELQHAAYERADGHTHDGGLSVLAKQKCKAHSTDDGPEVEKARGEGWNKKSALGVQDSHDHGRKRDKNKEREHDHGEKMCQSNLVRNFFKVCIHQDQDDLIGK